MQHFVVVGLVGRVSTLFGLLMVVPLLFSWAQHDGASRAIVISMLITISLGLATILARTTCARPIDLSQRTRCKGCRHCRSVNCYVT